VQLPRPVRATQNAHPRYASAAVRNPEHGGEGNRSKPKCRLRSPEPRRTTRHGLADDDNGKKLVARAASTCGVRMQELEDMHDDIIGWPDRAAA
jgi:hypothetical protein